MADHDMRDAEISRGCRQNDPAAWRSLVRTYTPLVYRMSLRMLKNEQEAEDVTQEVFIKVHRSITSHDPTRPLAPWLARIAYFDCLKRLAKTKRMAEKEVELYEDDLPMDNPDSSPESQVNRMQISQRVVGALDRLPMQDRALIVMRYREGFSDSEIAEATRMPVGTVKTKLYRARGKLKNILSPFFKEETL